MCDVGRRLWRRGLVAANEGNLSARLPNGSILCTPTLVSKGRLRPNDLAVVGLDGTQLAGPRDRTSEIRLHLTIYRRRPDVNAVVHSHPPHATAFALSDTPIPSGRHPEIELLIGPVPTAEYAVPGGDAFAATVEPHLDRTLAVLLARHGVVTFGDSLELAYLRAECLEAYCQTLILANSLGGAKAFDERQMNELLRVKAAWGFADPRFNPS